MKHRIRALFLDMGNVITTFDFKRFYHQLIHSRHTALSIEELDTIAHWHYRPLDRGEIDGQEYYERFRKDAEMPKITEEEFRRCFLSIFLGNNDHLDHLLHEIRRDIRIYLISNTNPIHVEHFFRNHPILQKHIPEERQILSYQVRASKPDREIYLRAMAIAGVQPHEGFFVDDMEENVTAWRNLGGKGIIYHAGIHAIHELRQPLQKAGMLKR